MSPEEIKQIKKGIFLTAAYYNRDLNDEVIQMMAEDLADLPFVKVSDAFLKYRRDPKNRTMPLPAQIRGIVEPTVTSDSAARDVVEKIKIAIRDFGYTNANLAKEYIGPAGWNIVRGMGGWQSVCESDFIHNSAMIAQARNRASDLNAIGEYESEQDQINWENKPNLIGGG
jgi:hypothetical protein